VGTTTAAMLAAVASVTAGMFAAAFDPAADAVAWMLATPLMLGVAWAYLYLARRGDVTFGPTLLALGLGVLVGAGLCLGHAAFFYRATGLWCALGKSAAGVDAWMVIKGVIAEALPHWAAAIVAAVLLVRGEGRLVLLTGGLFAGGVAGLVRVGWVGPVDGTAVGIIAGYAAAYAMLLPLLAWLGDQLHPLTDRAPRRVWPVIACVWTVPLVVLLIAGAALRGEWLSGGAQVGLMPVLLVLDRIREMHYGAPEPNGVQHAAVCLVGFALAVGLCASRRWAWVPWAVWLVHDVIYLCVLAATAAALLGNIQSPPGDLAEGWSPSYCWGFFASLMALGYVMVLRVWCLTRRGVRPTW